VGHVEPTQMCHPLRSIQVRIHTPRYDMELLRQWNIYKQPTLREHYDNYTLLKDVLRHPRQKDVGQALKLSHGRFLETIVNHGRPIDQFRYLKIQSKTIDLSTRLVGITTEFVGFIPTSLVLRSIVLD